MAPRSREIRGELYEQQERLETLGAQVHLCPIEFLPISSTMVRQAVREGKSLAGLVPPPVGRYIRERGLYRSFEFTQGKGRPCDAAGSQRLDSPHARG